MFNRMEMIIFNLGIEDTEEADIAKFILNICTEAEITSIMDLLFEHAHEEAMEEYEFLKFKYEDDI